MCSHCEEIIEVTVNEGPIKCKRGDFLLNCNYPNSKLIIDGVPKKPPRTSCECPPNTKAWGIGIGYYNTCGVCGVSYVTDIEKAMRPLEIITITK